MAKRTRQGSVATSSTTEPSNPEEGEEGNERGHGDGVTYYCPSCGNSVTLFVEPVRAPFCYRCNCRCTTVDPGVRRRRSPSRRGVA